MIGKFGDFDTVGGRAHGGGCISLQTQQHVQAARAARECIRGARRACHRARPFAPAGRQEDLCGEQQLVCWVALWQQREAQEPACQCIARAGMCRRQSPLPALPHPRTPRAAAVAPPPPPPPPLLILERPLLFARSKDGLAGQLNAPLASSHGPFRRCQLLLPASALRFKTQDHMAGLVDQLKVVLTRIKLSNDELGNEMLRMQNVQMWVLCCVVEMCPTWKGAMCWVNEMLRMQNVQMWVCGHPAAASKICPTQKGPVLYALAAPLGAAWADALKRAGDGSSGRGQGVTPGRRAHHGGSPCSAGELVRRLACLPTPSPLLRHPGLHLFGCVQALRQHQHADDNGGVRQGCSRGRAAVFVLLCVCVTGGVRQSQQGRGAKVGGLCCAGHPDPRAGS